MSDHALFYCQAAPKGAACILAVRTQVGEIVGFWPEFCAGGVVKRYNGDITHGRGIDMITKALRGLAVGCVAALCFGSVLRAEGTNEAAFQSGTVTTTVDLRAYPEGSEVRLWLPLPQSDGLQSISNVMVQSDGASVEQGKDAHGNEMISFYWDSHAPVSSRKASVAFHVTRREYRAPDFIEEGSIGQAERAFLGSEGPVVLSDEIKALAADIVKDRKSTVEKARAIYDWIVDSMVRDNSVVGCGTGDVCTLIHTKAGKCTDINSVFVALCRAAGVPAFEVFGLRINASDVTKNQHCWAKFYLPGTGWVIADPADVLKMVLTNKWTKDQKETAQARAYYFGNCDEKRVALSRGRALTLHPAQKGEPLNNFGYPYAEVNGKPVDWYAPETFVYSIAFEQD